MRSLTFLNFKNLPEISQVILILAHALAWRIRQLGHRLTIALDHFDDNLEGLVAQIIGEVSADTKGQRTSAIELPEQLNGLRHSQTIAEYQSFSERIDTIGTVMRNHPFTPDKWIATVMARAIKQLAKVHVKVAQESVETVDIA
jgi:hypothetical protein